MESKAVAFVSNGSRIYNRRVLERCVEYWFRVIKPSEFFFRSPTSATLHHFAIVGFDPTKQRLAAQEWRKSIFESPNFSQCILSYDGAKLDVKEQEEWETTLKPVNMAPSVESLDQICDDLARLRRMLQLVITTLLTAPDHDALLQRMLLQGAKGIPEAHLSEAKQEFLKFVVFAEKVYRASPEALHVLLMPAIVTFSPFVPLGQDENRGHHCLVADEIPGLPNIGNSWLIHHPSLPLDAAPENQTVQLAHWLKCSIGIHWRPNEQYHLVDF